MFQNVRPKNLIVAGVIVSAIIAAWVFWPQLSAFTQTIKKDVVPDSTETASRKFDILIVDGNVENPDAEPLVLKVPQELFDSKRFQMCKVGGAPTPEPLQLSGTLILDPNRHSRVHSLFSGQLVKVGLPGDMSRTTQELSRSPEKGLRVNDQVKAGQILAVIWSKDVGIMKTDLINQMSNARASKTILDRYLSVEEGAIAKTLVTQARQKYEADLVAVRNAERNLRAAQFTEEEIAIVRAEADKLFMPNAPVDKELERTWAEYPIRAPFDGVIVEKNVTVGDVIDPTMDLFKLAKFDRLQVLANVYEEDIPKIQNLLQLDQSQEQAAKGETSPGSKEVVNQTKQNFRSWKIGYQTNQNAPFELGQFEKLGNFIDPMQHTGTVHGWVENPHRKLIVGQFVTAIINQQPDENLVAIPTMALVEDAMGTTVFVARDVQKREFVQRKVAVVVRGREWVYLRKVPTAAEAQRGATALNQGDTILSRGAVELAGEVDTIASDLKAKNAADKAKAK